MRQTLIIHFKGNWSTLTVGVDCSPEEDSGSAKVLLHGLTDCFIFPLIADSWLIFHLKMTCTPCGSLVPSPSPWGSQCSQVFCPTRTCQPGRTENLVGSGLCSPGLWPLRHIISQSFNILNFNYRNVEKKWRHLNCSRNILSKHT